MKKVRKLKLRRETVHRLGAQELPGAIQGAADSQASVCRTCPGDPSCAPCGPTITRACCV